jgi:hypothetical protein
LFRSRFEFVVMAFSDNVSHVADMPTFRSDLCLGPAFQQTVATLQRGALVGVGAFADVAVNTPLWISAKRIAAGLGYPRVREMYKGSSLLWFSIGPTFMLEDLCSRVMVPIARNCASKIGVTLGSEGEEAVAAAGSGAVGGVLVASPIENVVVRGHRNSVPIGVAARRIFAEGGLHGLLLPKGAAAMVCREIPFAFGLFFFRERVAERWRVWTASDVEKQGSVKAAGRWWIGELGASLTTSALVNIFAHPASVVLAQQQAYDVRFSTALARAQAQGNGSLLRGLFKGFVLRTVSIAGTMTVVPMVLSKGHLFGLA